MACDPVVIIPSLGCTTGCFVDTTKDFINEAFASIDPSRVGPLPEFSNAQYAWNSGMSRLLGIDLNRPFETGQSHNYSRDVLGQWRIGNPTWNTIPGPSWTGPTITDTFLNATSVPGFNGRFGFQGAKIRLGLTARLIQSLYSDLAATNLISFTIHEAGQIVEFQPLNTLGAGPYQFLWPCRRGTSGASPHIIAGCLANPFT